VQPLNHFPLDFGLKMFFGISFGHHLTTDRGNV
jgi:hypothetical protein